jgi:hypothetical protein
LDERDSLLDGDDNGENFKIWESISTKSFNFDCTYSLSSSELIVAIVLVYDSIASLAVQNPLKRYSKLWNEIDILSKRERYLPGWQFYDLVKDYCVSQASQIHQQPHTIHDMADELQTSSTFFRLLLDRIRNSSGRRRVEIFERAVLDA